MLWLTDYEDKWGGVGFGHGHGGHNCYDGGVGGVGDISTSVDQCLTGAKV